VLHVGVSAVPALRHDGELLSTGGRELGLRAEARSPLWSRILTRASDERLVERAHLGDERAFQALVERYRPRLIAYCASIAGEAGAQDAVQQAFINVWDALRRGCEVQCVRPWLFTIARREALALRMREAVTDELSPRLAGGRTAEEQFELSRQAHAALVALAGLPRHERDVLLETSIHGRSGRELAGSLGLTETATRQLIFRARTRARAALGAWIPFGWLARLPYGAGRGVRRALAPLKHAASSASSFELGGPLSRIAPAIASGVLVAGPVAAVELTRLRDPHGAARQGRRAAAAQARLNAVGRGNAVQAESAQRAPSRRLRSTGAPAHAIGHPAVGRLSPGAGIAVPSPGAHEAPQAPVPAETSTRALAAGAANTPAAAHGVLAHVLAPVDREVSTDVAHAVKALAPGPGAGALEQGLTSVANVGRQVLGRTEAVAGSVSHALESSNNPGVTLTLP
jgi:RNA polymerase sigma factor (sigma-70 family)